MRVKNLPKLLFTAIFFALLVAPAGVLGGSGEGLPSLPKEVGAFRVQAGRADADFGTVATGDGAADFSVTGETSQRYVGPDGETFFVRAVKTASTSAAYSLLRFYDGGAAPQSKDGARQSRVGTVEGAGVLGVVEARRVGFIKGDTFVEVVAGKGHEKGQESLLAFAKSLADTLRGESGFVPVLVMHLPEWEQKVKEEVGYAVSLPALKRAAGDRPALDALSFDGGTEAVTAKYGDARLVVVEFPTPQHAFDADAAVTRRIEELRAAGQPAPSSYKRVGNYSVFVFDAPDSAAAENLISGVKYEKDVRWLGRNPHAEENAIRNYTSTMGGVILTTLITTGLAILACLTVGGLIGGAIFFSRRAKHAAQEIYSDAGGMLRLNIEDVNTPTTTKMLGRADD